MKRRVAPKALEAMKEWVREITSRNRGRNIGSVFEELRRYLTGWKEDCKLAETPCVFRNSDSWIHHRLRAVQLKRWRRETTVYRELRSRGVSITLRQRLRPRAERRWLTATYKAQKITVPDSPTTGWECCDLSPKPQPSEPPDADTHVWWCGKGVAGLIPLALSR